MPVVFEALALDCPQWHRPLEVLPGFRDAPAYDIVHGNRVVHGLGCELTYLGRNLFGAQ